MNKTTMGFGFLRITFRLLKGISFQLGKTGWNYYNQESIKINLFSLLFSLFLKYNVRQFEGCGELYREQDNYFKDGFRYVLFRYTKKHSTDLFNCKFVIVACVKFSLKMKSLSPQ
jgi:hypothetical protein